MTYVVYIVDKSRSLYKGYNIILTTYDVKAAGKLELGQSVKFKGLLNKYKGKKGRPIIVYLDQVEFN